jgi:hypothetical protein
VGAPLTAPRADDGELFDYEVALVDSGITAGPASASNVLLG